MTAKGKAQKPLILGKGRYKTIGGEKLLTITKLKARGKYSKRKAIAAIVKKAKNERGLSNL